MILMGATTSHRQIIAINVPSAKYIRNLLSRYATEEGNRYADFKETLALHLASKV